MKANEAAGVGPQMCEKLKRRETVMSYIGGESSLAITASGNRISQWRIEESAISISNQRRKHRGGEGWRKPVGGAMKRRGGA